MTLIGPMKYLTIGNKTCEIDTGSTLSSTGNSYTGVSVEDHSTTTINGSWVKQSSFSSVFDSGTDYHLNT